MGAAGFRSVETDDQEMVEHPLEHPVNAPRRKRSNVGVSTSLDYSNREVTYTGGSYLVVNLHPDDVVGPLKAWLRTGGSKRVVFAADLDSKRGVKCNIYVDTDEELSLFEQRGWDQQPVPVRMVPTGESDFEDLLDELVAAW